ncbi:hypothetical protein [Streptomyces antioxidans]|uniref:hypothetical protein n=1 Tax=Streptomyces TaxID=1883 RepID=UPI001F0A0C9B|nr:hypothetical protein [Streptomyces antioxidans]
MPPQQGELPPPGGFGAPGQGELPPPGGFGAPPHGESPPQAGFGAPPPEAQPYGQQQGWTAPERPAQPPYNAHQPPYNAQPPYDVQPPYPPQQQPYQAADETQVIPPQPAGDADATQVMPPVPGESRPPLDTPTTTLAQIRSAPLPPENRPESPAESTTQLRAVRPGHRGAHRQPPAAAEETAVLPPTPAASAPIPERPGSAPYAIRPGRPGDRPPPSEFDGLFRDAGGGGAGAADETQRFPQFGPDVPQPPNGGHGDGGGYDGHGGGGRRQMSRGVIIGIVVVASCAVAGLAAGAVLSMGGDDGKDNSTLSSSSPSAAESTKAADPVETQAKALDALLGDSNNSRSSVIKAVDNIKSCKDLTTAASDLRTAAGQRNDLVTRLGKLSVDKLPDHARLTASLTKAWKSSARADNEYAAWADQVGGKKGCPKGKARRTPRVGAAERASGEATQAKKTASGLWNPIASQYGLTARQATDL